MLLIIKRIILELLYIFTLALTPAILIPLLGFTIVNCFKTDFKNKTSIFLACAFGVIAIATFKLSEKRIFDFEKRYLNWVPKNLTARLTENLNKILYRIKILSFIIGLVFFAYNLSNSYQKLTAAKTS